MPGRFLAGIGAVIQRNDGRFLILRRSSEKDFAAGVWECVTGRLEQGEGYVDALTREVFEETGLSVTVDRILDTTHFYRGERTADNELIGVLYLCTTPEPYAFKPSYEHTEHRWVTTEEAMALLEGDDPSTQWMRGVVEQVRSIQEGSNRLPVDAVPTLMTDRLVLRPFGAEDAAWAEALVSDKEIAKMTSSIPHPYPKGGALSWIASQAREFADGKAISFAITLDGEGVGTISLMDIKSDHRRAELGYWIGKPFWGNGYATEAAKAVIAFAFEELNLLRVHARHMTQNPASGRVMEKCGMVKEGVMRQHLRKWGDMHDVVMYGIVKEEGTTDEHRWEDRGNP